MRSLGLLWLLFFSICCGLGYSTLNRYDPRKTPGVIHAQEHGATVAAEGSPVMQNRVLVPYAAKPFYLLAKGRIGTWDPVLFGLLVSNSLFTAATALLLVLVGRQATGDPAAALLAGLLYLLNFDVANYQLAGQVDSAECCFLMAVVATLSSKRWGWLPLWGVLGGLSKETFAPAALPLAFSWGWVVHRREGLGLGRALCLGALALAAVATTALALSVNEGRSLWPSGPRRKTPPAPGACSCRASSAASSTTASVHLRLAAPLGPPPAPRTAQALGGRFGLRRAGRAGGRGLP